MWRCKPAHSCRPTQDRMCKCGARCGAGSRTLAFLAPLVWHHGFKCSRPTRGRRGNARCGDATQSSSLVDYDKLRQGRGLSVGVAGFGTSNVEYLCSPALRTCGCECCVCVLCVRTCRCLLERVRACARALPCVRACKFLAWTCVRARKHESASVALPQSSTVTDAAQITQLSPNFSVLSGSSSLSMTSSQHRRTHPTTPRMLSRIVRLQLVHRESRRLVRLRPLRRRLGTAQPPISAGSAYVRRQRIRWTPNLL